MMGDWLTVSVAKQWLVLGVTEPVLLHTAQICQVLCFESNFLLSIDAYYVTMVRQKLRRSVKNKK